MSPQKFLEMVKKDCKEKKVRLHLSKGRYVVMDGTRCSGYFTSDEPPTLAVAMGRETSEWFPTLVHEYCHMQQWLDDTKIWWNANTNTDLWDWLSGKKELSSKKAFQSCMYALDCELDCERRSVKMIKHFGLPLKVDSYCQQANAYAYFYHLVYKHRRWYEVGKEPYNNRKIVSSMPKNLNGDHRTISDARVRLYEKCLGWTD